VCFVAANSHPRADSLTWWE